MEQVAKPPSSLPIRRDREMKKLFVAVLLVAGIVAATSAQFHIG
jgi:hypothetical protein